MARGAEEIDASASVVMPGFVDSDVHLVAGATHELSPRALKSLALRGVQEAVRCGTSAIGVKSADLKILRVHAALRELPLTLVSMFDVDGLSMEAAEHVCCRWCGGASWPSSHPKASLRSRLLSLLSGELRVTHRHAC